MLQEHLRKASQGEYTFGSAVVPDIAPDIRSRIHVRVHHEPDLLQVRNTYLMRLSASLVDCVVIDGQIGQDDHATKWPCIIDF